MAGERGDEGKRTRGREIRFQASAQHQSPILSVVEQPSKEPTAVVSAIIAIIATTVTTLVVALRERRGLSREEGRSGLGPLRRGRTRLIAALGRFGDSLLSRRCDTLLDNLVQLASIEPYTAAPGTVIDLDILPLGHNEIDSAYRAEKVLLRAAILVSHFDLLQHLTSDALIEAFALVF